MMVAAVSASEVALAVPENRRRRPLVGATEPTRPLAMTKSQMLLPAAEFAILPVPGAVSTLMSQSLEDEMPTPDQRPAWGA